MKTAKFYLTALSVLGFATQAFAADILPLPVPVRNIMPNEVLRVEDFTAKNFEVNEIARRNYLTSLVQTEKQVAARILRAGKPVSLRSLKKMADVRKGQPAIARYISDGIEIQGLLVPEHDGSIGDVIRARNPETGVVLDARVEQDGSLGVGIK